MDHPIQDRMCSTHRDQKCIVVNINPDCEPNQRHCCSTCLEDKKPRSIKDYDQAKAYLKENIKAFKREKEAQNKWNLDALKQVQRQITELKNFYNKTLDELLESVIIQEQFIQEQQITLDAKIQTIDIDSFLSASNELAHQEFHNKGFQRQFKEKINQILNQDVIKECLNQLETLDNKLIQLLPPPIPQQTLPDEKLFQTQNLLLFPFACPTHNEDIRFLLLNQTTPMDRRLACDQCLEQCNDQGKPMTVSKAYQTWKNIKDNAIKQTQTNQDKLKHKHEQLQDELKKYEKLYQSLLNATGNNLSQKYYEIEEKYLEQQKLFNKDWTILKINEALQIAQIISNPNPSRLLQVDNEQEYETANEDLNSILESSLLEIKNNQQDFFEQFIQMIGQERSRLTMTVNAQKGSRESTIINTSQQENTKNDIQKQEEKRKSDSRISVIQKQQRFNYQVIQQSRIVINEVCNAMAINKQLTVLVAGCGKQISVFEFIEGKLRQTQQLNDHTGDITSLYFMKNSNQFISGSTDNSIRVWGYNSFKQYGCDLILKNAHSKPVNSIITTNNEDLLITCSSIIKFWNNKPNWICWQKLKGNMDGVYSMSLNESQDTLVSTGYYGSLLSLQSGQICIIKPDHQGIWQIVQIIKTRKLGYKISYINNRVFAFSKQKGGKLHLYEYNEQQKQYVKSKFIKIDAEDDALMTLPQTFNQEKQLIVNQHGKSIHIIKVKDRQEFEISQTIKFETNKISGVMSDNGQYLITWDNSSHEVLVRNNQDES